jgi:hypothetical protein
LWHRHISVSAGNRVEYLWGVSNAPLCFDLLQAFLGRSFEIYHLATGMLDGFVTVSLPTIITGNRKISR